MVPAPATPYDVASLIVVLVVLVALGLYATLQWMGSVRPPERTDRTVIAGLLGVAVIFSAAFVLVALR